MGAIPPLMGWTAATGQLDAGNLTPSNFLDSRSVTDLKKSLDGRVFRASASGAVDSGLISSQIKPSNVKLVFTALLLDAQH